MWYNATMVQTENNDSDGNGAWPLFSTMLTAVKLPECLQITLNIALPGSGLDGGQIQQSTASSSSRIPQLNLINCNFDDTQVLVTPEKPAIAPLQIQTGHTEDDNKDYEAFGDIPMILRTLGMSLE